MSDGLISVIVPTFNRAYCLPRALDSALAQSYGNLEIILLDDGSTDDTRTLIEEKYGGDRRVRYVYQTNQGVSSARNHALELAEGQYIAFLDSDDFWEPWKLELQVACMERMPGVGMVWTDMQARKPDGTIADSRFLRKMYGAYRWFTNETLFSNSIPLREIAPQFAPMVGGSAFYSGDIYSAMIMGNLVHTSTVLIRRDRAQKVKGFNTEYRAGEDYGYHLHICKEGPVGLVDVPCIQYQVGLNDRLTAHKYRLETAQNFLTVVSNELEKEHERIKLPKKMIDAVLAEAHEWVGYELLEYNRTKEAHNHFALSLRYNLWQPNTFRLLAISCLPANVFDSLRQGFRRLKGAN